MNDENHPHNAGRGTVAGNPLLHSVDEACRRLSMHRTWLYSQIKAGRIVAIKLGRRTLIPESELQRVVAESRLA